MSNTTDKMLDRYVYLHIAPSDIEKEQTSMTIHVKLDDEGVVVDAWGQDEDGDEAVLATTWKTYNDMGVEVKKVKDAN